MTIDADPFADLTTAGKDWLTGAFAPVTDELDEASCRITGTLPSGLRGAFLRNGPNPAFAPLGRYHLFDGDGMIHGVTFDGHGKASYRNRWVRSAGFRAEAEAGHALFGGMADFRPPPPEVAEAVGAMKNVANTHVVRHAGRILALWEATRPTELTPELETVGEYDFGGALTGAMTAHPKVDPVSGEMVFFGASPFPPYVTVHSVDTDGAITWSTTVELPNPVMMHDFVITATKVVIFDLPVAFDIPAMLSGGPGFYWAPDQGARIGVLDRGAPGDTIRWVEIDPFWVFHFLNGHDDGDAVVVTGCRSPRLNTSFGDDEITERIEPTLHRWRIDPGKGTVTVEQLDDRGGDFPRMDDRRAGLDARYGYLGVARTSDDENIEFDSVVKHDLRAGTSLVHCYGTGAMAGEPVFAADPDDDREDAGWILNWVIDRATAESAMVVLDAGTLDEVARVHPPRRVPFGFHGSFLPDPA